MHDPQTRASILPMTRLPADRLVRQVAHAAGSFEHTLLGRTPSSITVVADRSSLVVNLLEPLSPVERRLCQDPVGASRVREFHRDLFEAALEALVGHVRRLTGIELCAGLAHVDPLAGGVVKTLTTHPGVDLVLLGRGLPALGVPVNAHLHTDGINGTIVAGGNGAVRA
jgi:uncharacterized protein YbcI